MTKIWDAANYQARHAYVFAHGESLIELLDPQPGEKVLDLGCGSGQLTSKIAERGAEVMGVDHSPEMIAEARCNFPSLKFDIADAAKFAVGAPLDAVFSNAALHWVKDADGAAESVAKALRPGGRFVLEMGGKGNVQQVIDAVLAVAGRVETPWYFPSVGEYTSLLEWYGFEIAYASLFDRPTRVEGEDGLEDWLSMFATPMLATFDAARATEIRREAAERLRPGMYHDGGWILDYRRLRIVAKCHH